MENSYKLSVVVPVYNEEDNLFQLHKELNTSLREITSNFEIIYVNDGSTDNSLSKLKALNNSTTINLQRNYGQAVALDAGFKNTSGDYIISIDGDLQNDPSDIKKLLDKLKSDNLDVVIGWRKVRKDSWQVNLFTRVGRLLRKILMHDTIKDTGCTLRIYRKEAVRDLNICGEMHRYILSILKWQGFKIDQVEVNHRPRIHGKSKYNFTKTIRGLIDLIYIWFIHKYSQRPLHLFGYFSIMAFILGTLSGAWTLYGKLFMNLSLNRNGWFFITFFMFLSSIILFSFGVVIDLLIKIQLNTSANEKRYRIKEVIKV